MKNKLLYLLLFLSLAIKAQENFVYASVFVDPNNLLGVIDNPRTQTETTGLDYDIEIGARNDLFTIYMFYGAFPVIDYQNMGFGVDVNVNLFEFINTSLGFNYGFVTRTYEGASFSFLALGVRGIVSIPISEKFAIPLKLQLQQRPDIRPFGILEGSIGLTFKIDRK